MVNKVVASAKEAVADIPSGSTLYAEGTCRRARAHGTHAAAWFRSLVGGFGLCGIPEHLIAAVRDTVRPMLP